jgi:hypothetical protein
MLYPQITGEPNFILIGVSAVFGLLVIIIVYYIVVSKSRNPSRLYPGGRQLNNLPMQGNLNPNITTLDATTATPANTMPVPINSGGYYAVAPVPRETSSGPTQSNSSVKQVFNIKENIYAADDAGGVCGALGSDVATLQQLVDAHRQGANWCNVGWTKEGLAAYPIQNDFWKKRHRSP